LVNGLAFTLNLSTISVLSAPPIGGGDERFFKDAALPFF
jgi:hypothetical protein